MKLTLQDIEQAYEVRLVELEREAKSWRSLCEKAVKILDEYKDYVKVLQTQILDNITK